MIDPSRRIRREPRRNPPAPGIQRIGLTTSPNLWKTRPDAPKTGLDAPKTGPTAPQTTTSPNLWKTRHDTPQPPVSGGRPHPGHQTPGSEIPEVQSAEAPERRSLRTSTSRYAGEAVRIQDETPETAEAHPVHPRTSTRPSPHNPHRLAAETQPAGLNRSRRPIRGIFHPDGSFSPSQQPGKQGESPPWGRDGHIPECIRGHPPTDGIKPMESNQPPGPTPSGKTGSEPAAR